ncbi:MAG: hypothetical protein U0871_01400 [Gemmataceae bacterium]
MGIAVTDLFDAIDRSLDKPTDPADSWPPADTQRLLEQLSEAYLAADADGRAAIRAFIAARATGADVWLMWTCASRLAERVAGPDAGPALRLALAAVSADNCSADYRDTLGVLLKLYDRAERAGVDPGPAFEAAAALSADTPTPGGCPSVAGLIRQVGAREVRG